MAGRRLLTAWAVVSAPGTAAGGTGEGTGMGVGDTVAEVGAEVGLGETVGIAMVGRLGGVG